VWKNPRLVASYFTAISSKADQGNNTPVRALLVRLETVAVIGNTSNAILFKVDRIQL